MKRWLERLNLNAPAHSELLRQADYAYLFQPNAAQWIKRNVLQVTLPMQEGIQDHIGKIFPAASWIQEENDSAKDVVFNLYDGNARDYEAEYHRHFPQQPIEPWYKGISQRRARDKVNGDFYILASSAIQKEAGVPDVKPTTKPDGTEILSFKVLDSLLVSEAIERLRVEYEGDFVAVFHKAEAAVHPKYLFDASGLQLTQGSHAIPAKPAMYSIILSGDAARLFALQNNAFIRATGHSAPEAGQWTR